MCETSARRSPPRWRRRAKPWSNQILNVGDNDNNYRVREIAEAIGEAFPNCQIEFGSNAGDNRSYRVCFDKIKQVLPGFRCEWSARQGRTAAAQPVRAHRHERA